MVHVLLCLEDVHPPLRYVSLLMVVPVRVIHGRFVERSNSQQLCLTLPSSAVSPKMNQEYRERGGEFLLPNMTPVALVLSFRTGSSVGHRERRARQRAGN